MDIVKTDIEIQIVLIGLVIALICVIHFISMRWFIKREGVYKAIFSGIIVITLGFTLFRFISWEHEGRYYVYEFREEFDNSYNFVPDSRFLNRIGISKEDLEYAMPLDRVIIYTKEDTSDVTILDILFCNTTKWLEGEIVSSTDYAMLSGKDVELVVDYTVYDSTINELSPSQDRRVIKYMYIELDGVLYAVDGKTPIDNDKRYVLMWDSLDKVERNVSGKVRDVYQTCVISEYIG